MKNMNQKSRKSNSAGYEAARDPNERRTCCHRCGNVRKSIVECNSCPQIFCTPCAGKMQSEYGSDVFNHGCPVCKEICCCHHKTMKCKKTHHCYKKCPTARAQRGLSRKGSSASLSNMDDDTHESSSSTPEELRKSDDLQIEIPGIKLLDPFDNAPWLLNDSGTPSGIAGLSRFSPYAVRNSTIKKSLFALEVENNNKRKRSIDAGAPGSKKPYLRGADSPLARTIEKMNPDQLRSHMDKALDTFGSDFPDISWFQQTPLSGYPLLRSLSDFDDPFLFNSNYQSKHVLMNDFGENEMDNGSDDNMDSSCPNQSNAAELLELKHPKQVRPAEQTKLIPLKFDKRPKSILKPLEIDEEPGFETDKVHDIAKQGKVTYNISNANIFSSPRNDYDLNYLVSSYKHYGAGPSGSLPSLSPYPGKFDVETPNIYGNGQAIMDVYSSSDDRTEHQQFYPELFDHSA